MESSYKFDARRGRVNCSTMKSLLKWECYSAAAEEMMIYVNDNENIDLGQQGVDRVQIHTPSPITKDYKLKNSKYMICSVEESLKRKVLGVKCKKSRGFVRNRKLLLFVMIQTVIQFVTLLIHLSQR